MYMYVWLGPSIFMPFVPFLFLFIYEKLINARAWMKIVLQLEEKFNQELENIQNSTCAEFEYDPVLPSSFLKNLINIMKLQSL